MAKFLLVASLLIISISCRAQELNESNIGQLLIFSGKVDTYYSNGCETKARYFQELLQDAVLFYQDKLHDTIDIKLFVLDKHDWKLFSGSPYILPYYANDPVRIVVGINELFKIELQESETLYGAHDAYFWDFIIVHELGHYISQKHKVKSIRWTSEFFADYLMVGFMLERIPQLNQSSMIATLFQFLPFKYKTLKDFESNYSRIDPLNYSMYQAKFQELAFRIYEKRGWDFMYDYIDRFSQEINPPPNSNSLLELTLNEFQKMEPEIFDEWNERMRQTFHPLVLMVFLLMVIVSLKSIDNSYSIFTKAGLESNRRYKIQGVPTRIIISQLKHIDNRKSITKLKVIVGLRPIMYLIVLLFILLLLLHH